MPANPYDLWKNSRPPIDIIYDPIVPESKDSKEMIEVVDFFFQCLGLSISFEEFKSLSKEQKMALIRESKINSIL